jgi:catechol-2,3-dioxygenase
MQVDTTPPAALAPPVTNADTLLTERAANPTIRARGLSHIVLERPDLARAQQFFIDFGLRPLECTPKRLLMAAPAATEPCVVVDRGRRARLVGLGLLAAEPRDLERVARLPGASRVGGIGRAQSEPAPVRLRDPAGLCLEVACRDVSEPLITPPACRAVNERIIPSAGLAVVRRLGHLVLNVVHFAPMARFYIEHFGLLTSDVQCTGNGQPMISFMRFDRGSVPVDHHAFVLIQHVVAGLNHVAFEMDDLDEVARAHDELKRAGWRHSWGIGRHLLGSQIFDYWADPWGALFEHYADGDRFDASRAPSYYRFGATANQQWGPPPPRAFTLPTLSADWLRQASRNLVSNPGLDRPRVRALLGAALRGI